MQAKTISAQVPLILLAVLEFSIGSHVVKLLTVAVEAQNAR